MTKRNAAAAAKSSAPNPVLLGEECDETLALLAGVRGILTGMADVVPDPDAQTHAHRLLDAAIYRVQRVARAFEVARARSRARLLAAGGD